MANYLKDKKKTVCKWKNKEFGTIYVRQRIKFSAITYWKKYWVQRHIDMFQINLTFRSLTTYMQPIIIITVWKIIKRKASL